MLGDLLAEQRARLGEDAVAEHALGAREHGLAARIGARGGAELHRDLEEGAGEALPEEAEDGVGARVRRGRRRCRCRCRCYAVAACLPAAAGLPPGRSARVAIGCVAIGRVAIGRQLGGELLELDRAHLGQVRDRGDQELGLRREVVQERAARDVGAALHLERRRAGEADLDQRLDRGVEQRAPRLIAALLLRARGAGGLGHPARGVPPVKQSVKTVCL